MLIKKKLRKFKLSKYSNIVLKDWGYYATPLINGWQKKKKFKNSYLA